MVRMKCLDVAVVIGSGMVAEIGLVVGWYKDMLGDRVSVSLITRRGVL
jgi:hypothetical protein